MTYSLANKSLLVTLLLPKLSSKSTLCNALDLVPNLLSQLHPMAMWSFNKLRHCFFPRIFTSSLQEGTMFVSLSELLCKGFSISFVKILHNITEVVQTHQCHSLTQQMKHVQSSRPSINKELTSYLLPFPFEVMVAES